MIAVLPVRGGVVPAGADETVAEAGGRVLVVGRDAEAALASLLVPPTEALVCEAGDFAPAAWARHLAAWPEVAAADVVLLPASPDGRDLAPRLAASLRRPLVAGAVAVTADRVVALRWGGRVLATYEPHGPAVATLEPGCRGVPPTAHRDDGGTAAAGRVPVRHLPPPPATGAVGAASAAPSQATVDATVIEVSPPDPSSMDLAEAGRIVAGGAGLLGPGAFDLLAAVATALGASMGATRVVTDAGLVPHERQIGTTGVAVNPRLYVALGISGAVQHTGGLGSPEHIVAVNLDPSCPMMTMADLAIVADARAVLDALADRLGVQGAFDTTVGAGDTEHGATTKHGADTEHGAGSAARGGP